MAIEAEKTGCCGVIPKAKDIKPKVLGQSDFFSWQLYRWVKKNEKGSLDFCRIWHGTWNSATGFNGYQPLYIGRKNENGCWFSGIPIRYLCRRGHSIDEIYAFDQRHGVSDWRDVTAYFWEDYVKRGVCAIHGDFAHKWIEGGNKRTCEYCGKKEIKRVLLVTKEIWEMEE